MAEQLVRATKKFVKLFSLQKATSFLSVSSNRFCCFRWRLSAISLEDSHRHNVPWHWTQRTMRFRESIGELLAESSPGVVSVSHVLGAHVNPDPKTLGILGILANVIFLMYRYRQSQKKFMFSLEKRFPFGKDQKTKQMSSVPRPGFMVVYINDTPRCASKCLLNTCGEGNGWKNVQKSNMTNAGGFDLLNF